MAVELPGIPRTADDGSMSWEIDWFICRADAKDVEWQATRHLKKGETRRVLSVGDELWRVPRAIGPLRSTSAA